MVRTLSLPILVGLAAGALAVRERERGRAAQRLAAATLEALLNTIDANDETTGAHVRRVATYALIVADALGLPDHICHDVERVALFHDIGKIHEALFDIVHERTRITPEERSRIATHPQKGADVLAPLAPFYPALPEGVLAHHERWDGSGYPRRLRGTSIPLTARIVAIADTFDVVTNGRPYRRRQSAAEAAQVIADGRGTQFDPRLVDAFLHPETLACMGDALHMVRTGRPPRPERRVGRREPAPRSLSFRWRSKALARPLPDRARPGRRG